MENNNLWHYKNPNSKQLQLAIKEINNNKGKTNKLLQIKTINSNTIK